MTQTLLAISSMMLASVFMLQQQRNLGHARQAIVRNEVQTLATRVAMDRLGEVGAMAFDEATKGGETLSSSAALTDAAVFTVDAPPVDDMDDFDGAVVQQYRVVWADTLWFEVSTGVAYADEVDPDQAAAPGARTKFKKATVRVESLSMPSVPAVELSQSFSCGTRCDW